jgi:hypothetical protein
MPTFGSRHCHEPPFGVMIGGMRPLGYSSRDL